MVPSRLFLERCLKFGVVCIFFFFLTGKKAMDGVEGAFQPKEILINIVHLPDTELISFMYSIF